MATVKKVEDTKFVAVVISNRNPESEERSCFVGGNNIIINGKPTIKHYTVQLNEEVSLPEPFIKQLKERSMVGKGKDGKIARVPLFVVEQAEVEVA